MQKFKDIEYKRPDVNALKAEMKAAIKRFKEAKSAEEANKIFLEINSKLEPAETMMVICNVRNTMNMADKFYDAEMNYWNSTMPRLMPLFKKFSAALVESPYRKDLEAIYGEHYFKDAEIEQKLFNKRIILPMIKENKLSTEYSKTAAACSVEFMGEKCNFYGLLRHMESTDRAERKAAFEEWAKLYEGISPKLDEIYGKLVALRRKKAKRLGFNSYIDYIYLSRGRYDYGAKEAAEFREAVRKYITPLCEKLYADQQAELGVDKLQVYDESLTYADGNANPVGTPEELVKKAQDMYAAISPETKEFFDFMVEHELFDFVTRENKHLGGYMTQLPEYKAPFIFSNFNGTAADIDVLTHEAGHAFEYYYGSRRLPINGIVGSTSEINEIHSMTMEHFTYPYMDSFFGEKADKYRFAHFTDAVKCIPYLVSVDEFQHLVYENPGSGPADWRRFWKQTEQKYMPWRSYDGNAFLEGGGFWMQKQHIFLYPFYYIDYALAALGAFSLYRKQVEGGDAWSDYLTLCSIGGKYGYFETLSRAGIPLPLKEETVRAAAEFCEKQAEELKKAVK
ncbi:MAG: M3 family oligoendopeptidase [Clostridia bacterium]|nr:M3 family oligoendopeptidase [Clostridia bacterium]MBR5747036.1 M3 family oligoendopeptidase [Clostridia bacterium]